MSARRIAVLAAVGSALAVPIFALNADALTIAQVSQYGYVLVDEPNSLNPYNGSASAGNPQGFANFIADVTTLLDTEGAPHGNFVAVMQLQYEPAALAFYSRIRNETRGLGFVDPLGSHSETYDLNDTYGNAFHLDGAVFLNTVSLYTDHGNYGPRVICPQEFAHRFLAEAKVPPYPAAVADGGVPGVGPQAADVLLGRDLAHWSYFMNTGGSPMEGNPWDEISPGVFRTGTPSYVFSDLELYLLGLEPASAVAPFFIIANPDVMNQTDQGGGIINRASGPEGFGNAARTVEIRGTRLTYSIDDVIAANGPRVPAYQDPDGGVGSDAGSAETSVRDMKVIWVLVTTADQVNAQNVAKFDQAVAACAAGYQTSTRNLAHLTATVLPRSADAGTEAGSDAGTDARSDAGDVSGDVYTPSNIAAFGGCGCRTTSLLPGKNGTFVIAMVLLVGSLRRSRRRTR